MTRIRIAIAAGAAVVITSALALAPAPAATSTKLYATLSGKQEVPGKGDPNGTATATITFSSTRGTCYIIRPKRLEGKIAAAHIHSGKRGKAGGIAIDLFVSPKTARNGRISGCTKGAASAAVDNVRSRPANFYVNVHTATYPNGAARGQLSTKKP